MKRKRKSQKGSLTVMAALCFMMIAQVLFTLAEGCRWIELEKEAEMTSDAAVESMMADYCRPMWDYYHLLCYDASGSDSTVSTDQMTAYLRGIVSTEYSVEEGTGSSTVNLLRLGLEDVCFNSCTLLTDGGGTAYIKAVSAYMKNNGIAEAMKKTYSSYESAESLEEEYPFSKGPVKSILKLLQKAGTGTRTASGPPADRGSAVNATPGYDSAGQEAVLQQVADTDAAGILKSVLPAGTVLSKNNLGKTKLLSGRKLEKGISPEVEAVTWTDSLLLRQYLLSYLQSFRDTQSRTAEAEEQPHALSYELEYLLGGKAADEENLKVTAEKLLLLRAAANAAYLGSSSKRKSELKAAATALCAAILQPELEPAAETGLLAAWAYTESIMDLRTLLAGGKVPLIKNDSSWTSTLSAMGDILKGKGQAKSSEKGLTYEDYLGILLFGVKDTLLAKRAMDMQEASVQKLEHYESFRLDHGCCSVRADFSYSSGALFFSFVTMLRERGTAFGVKAGSEYSYLKK